MHAAFRPWNNTLRLLYYPERNPDAPGQYGIGPHRRSRSASTWARSRAAISI
jgi:hypothetical protein